MRYPSLLKCLVFLCFSGFLFYSILPVFSQVNDSATQLKDTSVFNPDTLQDNGDSVNYGGFDQRAPGDSARLSADSSMQDRPLTHEDIVRGERLFYGLIYNNNPELKCISCHNLTTADTVNWNPNAVEISQKYHDRNVEDLSRVLLKPAGQKMAEVHKTGVLTPADIRQIKAFMDEIPERGMQNSKPVVTNLILFIIASLLLLFSLTDLMITKKIRMIWVHLLILTITGGFITYRLVVDAIDVGRSEGYSPDQPVKFSHAVHAGQNKTECTYCHSSAPYSKNPTIPALNVCMNCHLVVRNGSRSGAFEIAKVVASFENRIPVKWTKVYKLPDHVYYDHSQHVNAGGIECQTCHGPVEEMDRITQIRDLSMGWCVNCHRDTKVNFKNNMYSHYTELSHEMEEGSTDSVTVEMIGGTECMKCHY